MTRLRLFPLPTWSDESIVLNAYPRSRRIDSDCLFENDYPKAKKAIREMMTKISYAKSPRKKKRASVSRKRPSKKGGDPLKDLSERSIKMEDLDKILLRALKERNLSVLEAAEICRRSSYIRAKKGHLRRGEVTNMAIESLESLRRKGVAKIEKGKYAPNK